MRTGFVLFILSLSIYTQAQNAKNEVQIGVPGAYFFGESVFRLHNLKSIPIPTSIVFSRKLNKSFGVKAGFDYYWLGGDILEKKIYYGFVLARHVSETHIGIFHEISITDKIVFHSSIIFQYRGGGEIFHVRYTTTGGIRWEAIADSRKYQDLGIGIAAQITIGVYRNYSIGGRIRYSRYIAEPSPNQLSSSFFVGYKF